MSDLPEVPARQRGHFRPLPPTRRALLGPGGLHTCAPSPQRWAPGEAGGVRGGLGKLRDDQAPGRSDSTRAQLPVPAVPVSSRVLRTPIFLRASVSLAVKWGLGEGFASGGGSPGQPFRQPLSHPGVDHWSQSWGHRRGGAGLSPHSLSPLPGDGRAEVGWGGGQLAQGPAPAAASFTGFWEFMETPELPARGSRAAVDTKGDQSLCLPFTQGLSPAQGP